MMRPYKVELNLFPRKTVHVVAGAPIDLDDLREQPVTEQLLQIGTTRLLDTITSMEAEIRGETPPNGRWNMATGERLPVAKTPNSAR